ncbi:hypothetical protein EYB26_001760 [Talaromyces marneffei]|uniref:F-box domain-containing protein n=1 Tax=Talaromyces marneffei PM1 TaxID=1077442 RepID=A0A093V5Q0_TALMA|nr:uncharacterized protein EYB26_001760 [Talaromyces marneffei]QGA14107.1 hypothetical protein EYB26_001760 [Talaromyces marneffei]
MAISTRSFFDLPNELIEEILKNVPDLHSVHSASQTCTRLFKIYQASQLEIIRSTILRIPDRQPETKVYDLLRILQFVIKQAMVQRDVARSILQDGWKLLAEKEHEQLLIPFGKALAWSYASDKRESEAIHLLRTIWDQNVPFLLKEPEDTWSGRPSTLLPVKRLLDQLYPMDDSHSPTTTELREFQGVPIAKICPGEIEWNATISQLDEFQQTQLLKNGILFEKDFIMIKFSPMIPTLESPPPSPTPLPTMSTYRFGSNATNDRALIESLDDELVTKLRYTTWWSTEIRRY